MRGQEVGLTRESKRRSEKGSVFTILLAGVAIAGALSVVLYQTISGPMSSMVRVTNKTTAKSQMQTVASIAIMDAINNLPNNGDCTAVPGPASGFVVPRSWVSGTPHPTGGGTLPSTIGAPTTDPWGTPYGYCVWEVGYENAGVPAKNASCDTTNGADQSCTSTGGCSGGAGSGYNANRLIGTPTPASGSAGSEVVLAIISAGPNRTFETTCANYNNTNGTTQSYPLVYSTAGGQAANAAAAGGGDDIVLTYTYAAASTATSSLWTLSPTTPSTAVISKDISVGTGLGTVPTAVSGAYSNGIVNANAVVTTGAVIAGGQLEMGPNTTAAMGAGTCTSGNLGGMYYNTTTLAVDVCSCTGTSAACTGGTGTYSWTPLATASGTTAALNNITSATGSVASGTVANSTNTIVWNWALSTATTGLTLANTDTSASTATTLAVTSAITGTGNAIKASMTGTSGASAAIYGTNASATTGAGGIYGIETGASNAGYGVGGTDNGSSNTGTGISGVNSGSSNTGYGVYGINSGTTNTGAGGYFTNSGGGYSLITGTGNVGIGTATPGTPLTVAGPISLEKPVTPACTSNAYTVNVTVAPYDSSLIFADASGCTVTLPAVATYPGQILLMSNNAAGAIVSNAANVLPQGSTTAGTAILPATVGAWALLQDNGTNWVIMASGLGSSTVAWNAITNPTGNLALTMGADTSTFTYNNATGAANLFNLTDTATNSSATGYLLNLTTTTASTLKPLNVSVNGGVAALDVIANGNVGIGTTAPAGTLDVRSQTTTLSAAITTTSATSISVAANTFPASGSLLIDAEQMTYTGGGTTTFTVVRGVNGTTAATHLVSATVVYGVYNTLLGATGGYVGIGTAAPGSTLDTRGTSGKLLNVQNPAQGWGILNVNANGTSQIAGNLSTVAAMGGAPLLTVGQGYGWPTDMYYNNTINTYYTSVLFQPSITVEASNAGSDFEGTEIELSVPDDGNPHTIRGAHTLTLAPGVMGSYLTVTQPYALFIKPFASTFPGAYAIAQTGASDLNYFAGNVGIGTSTPGGTFDVEHGGTTTGVAPGTISSSGTAVTGSGTSFQTTFAVGDTIISSGQSATIATIASNTALTTTGAFSPAIALGSSYSRVGALFNAGNIGIGTTAPLVKLDLTGSPATDTLGTEDELHITRLVNGGVSWPQLAAFQLGTYNTTAACCGPQTRLDINLKAAANSTLTGDTNVMSLLSSGNVGIGNTAPGTLLTVAGPISLNEPAAAITATSYPVATTDSSLIFAPTATTTVTLPLATSYPGRILYLTNTAAYLVNSGTTANEEVIPQIGGSAGTALLPATAGAWAELQSNGTNWVTMASGSGSGGSGATAINGLLDAINSGPSPGSAGNNDLLLGNAKASYGLNSGVGAYNTAVGIGALTTLTSGTNNTALGYNALNANNARKEDTAVGYEAMQYADSSLGLGISYNTALGAYALEGSSTLANNTGIKNTAIGHSALLSNTSGNNNIAVGYDALTTNTAGIDNTAIGVNALNNNSGANNSTAVGYQAMSNANNTTVSWNTNNTAVGYQALQGSATPANNTGTANTALGMQALMLNSSGYNLTATGYAALQDNTSGYNNTAVGVWALQNNVANWESTAVGFEAMYYASNTTAGALATDNTAVGAYALEGSVTAANNYGIRNTAIGHSALLGNTSGTSNIAVGYAALTANTSGFYNTAIGTYALNSSSGANKSTAVGFEAMQNANNTTGSWNTDNTAVGYQALQGGATPSLNTGISNTAIGDASMSLNEAGSNNATLGFRALLNNVGKNESTAVGYWAMYYADSTTNNVPSYNTAVGAYALQGATNGQATNTGTGNTAIGHSAGYGTTGPGTYAVTSGSNNTYIGYNAAPGTSTQLTNAAAIGANASVTASNAMVLGNAANVGIGTTAPAGPFDVEHTGTPMAPPGTISSSGTTVTGSGTATFLTTFAVGDTIISSGQSETVATVGTNTSLTTAVAFSPVLGAGSSYSRVGSILNAGYVGIGTTTPQTLLTVAGPISLNEPAAAIVASSYSVAPTDSSLIFAPTGTTTVTLPLATSYPGRILYLQNTAGYLVNSGTTANEEVIPLGGTTAGTTLLSNAAGSWAELQSNGTNWVTMASGGGPGATAINGLGDAINSGPSPGSAGNNDLLLGNAKASYGLNSGSGTDNTAVGILALTATTGGGGNTALGYQALNGNIALSASTAVGYEAMQYAYSTTAGGTTYNTAVGYQALQGSVTASANSGVVNTAVGVYALKDNTTGSSNAAVGAGALWSNTTGTNNVAVGNSLAAVSSLQENTVGNNNTAVGATALGWNVAGNESTAVGYYAMFNANNTTAPFTSYNTAVGAYALEGSVTPQNNTGVANVAVGHSALLNNTSGGNNTAVGVKALLNNTAAVESTAVGYEAMQYIIGTTANSGSSYNTAVGAYALQGGVTTSLNIGLGNTAVGDSSLTANTSGQYNTAVGYNVMNANTTGNTNTALGKNALPNNTIGSQNMAIGSGALYSAVALDNNTAIGYQTMYYAYNTTVEISTYDTAIGWQAMHGPNSAGTNTGVDNTGIGYSALWGVSSGNDNTAIGYNAGYTGTNVSTGSENTFIGSTAGMSGGSQYTNATAIGYGAAATASNQVMLGNSSVTAVNTSGVVIAGNSVSLVANSTGLNSTTYVSTGLVLPTIPISTTVRGHCTLMWTVSATSWSVWFAMVTNNAPTGLWVYDLSDGPGASPLTQYTAITTAATTAVTAGMSIPTVGATDIFFTNLDFTLQTSATATEQITIDYKSTGGGSSLTLYAGSSCGWYP